MATAAVDTSIAPGPTEIPIASLEKVKVSVINFLSDVIPILIGCPKSQLTAALTSKFSGADIALKNYISDPQARILVIGKEPVPDEQVPGEPDSRAVTRRLSAGEIDAREVEYRIFVSLEVDRRATTTASVGVIKRANVTTLLEQTGGPVTIGSRLQVVPVGAPVDEDDLESSQGERKDQAPIIGASPLNLISTYLQLVADPVFVATAAAQGGEADDDVAVRNIAAARKKLTEFLSSVRQVQQNAEVPLIQLPLDPLITDAVTKAKAAGKKFSPEDFLNETGDQDQTTAVLNRLQSLVNRWIRDIQKVVKIDRDPSIGTVAEEINFWHGCERALLHIEEQLQTPEVDATIQVLRLAKRFLAGVSFESDTGLKARLEAVQNVNSSIMRDFPISDLSSATSVDQITSAVRRIFVHLRRSKNVQHYAVPRWYKLADVISKEVAVQLRKVLSNQRLMLMGADEFEHVYGNCRELNRTWEEGFHRFKEQVRDQQIKKKGVMAVVSAPKPANEHSKVLDRIEDIRKVRRHHQRLQSVVRKVLSEGGSESAANREITSAFVVFHTIDPLDVTNETWDAAKKLYNAKIDRVESQITNRLRDKLGSAKTGIEMASVFSQFNPLFFRPRIRSAIQEYQVILLDQLKDDLRTLQIKFQTKYESTANNVIANVLDIPPIGGHIVWAKQLERKLELTLRRVEDVLGKNWHSHSEGQNIKAIGDDLAKKFNPQDIFDKWYARIKDTKSFELSGHLFKIRHHGGKGYELLVDFNHTLMFLFKEVRFLTALGFRVPYSIKVISDDGKWIYPFMVSLQESVRAYHQTCLRLDDPRYVNVVPLSATYRKNVQELLAQGCTLRWDFVHLENYATDLSQKVSILEAKVEDAQSRIHEIDRLVDDLKTAPFTFDGENFKNVLDQIQGIIADLALSNYSNLPGFSRIIDREIEEILMRRLEELVDAWVAEFEDWPENGVSLINNGSLHEFRISTQQLTLYPPVEAARQHWTTRFHLALGTICQLKRVAISNLGDLYPKSASPTQRSSGVQPRGKQDRTFRNLPQKMNPEKLQKAYSAINTALSNLQQYVDEWFRYQYLWDVELGTVLNQVGEDVEAWQQMLHEIRNSRAMLDDAEERKNFGPIVVDYGNAQQKVLLKFEGWHREVLSVFASKIRDQIAVFASQLQKARQELDQYTGDTTKLNFLSETGSVSTFTSETQRAEMTSQVTQFVLQLQESKSRLGPWDAAIGRFIASERLLERQRFAFPSNWIWTDSLISDWEAVQQLLRHQSVLFERYRSQLSSFVTGLSQITQANLSALYVEWARVRPTRGDTQPATALQTIQRIAGRLQSTREEYMKVHEALKALDISEPAPAQPGEALLSPEALQDELTSLKSVWTELKDLYAALDILKETSWAAVSPKKVRQGLTDLLAQIKKIPAKFRQYEAFEHLQNSVASYLKLNPLLTDMRTEALKERHWKRLLETLNLARENYNDLTLGHLWNADIEAHEEAIRKVLFQAQGELALEQFLHSLRTTWGDYNIDMVVYKNRCKLIRGWEELFSLVDDHLASLQSMRLSPYFKIFEEEANGWEEKLSRLRSLLDTWMEVQRRWVYLEGVFTGSADIQALLPKEFARFKQIDNDFISIAKKTAARPKVLDLLAAEGLQRSLDRLLDLLAKIQKALGEYLERQRLKFPRFYFVGDEDLLEMIGNSKDAAIVQRHLNKMFAGIANLQTAEDSTDVVSGMISKEGEVVSFRTHVVLTEHSGLNGWLQACEMQMTRTLAHLLYDAVQELQKSDIVRGTNTFFDWMRRYPCQITMVALQINWTTQCEGALRTGRTSLKDVEKQCSDILEILAERVLHETDKIMHIKLVQTITEMVHQRGVVRELIGKKVDNERDFTWLQHIRFYYDLSDYNDDSELSKRFVIRMANAEFLYGFEYLGIPEKLVQTALTDKAYLTLTQALHLRLGGNPFGPAGTGKTETVKALGAQLGRFVLVFCCDETFDFNAMGRIFVGLCQVGAWGCFDEFNRLEERILSACSEQILTIQTGLRANQPSIELINREVKLNQDMGIFVTMNPGYAGRSNLPDNLKQLFREIAMINPDKVQIVQVLLYSQGFKSAERLSSKVVSLFDLCLQQLSQQPHYDFGLRSLKNVLGSAGHLKRAQLQHAGLVSDVVAGGADIQMDAFEGNGQGMTDAEQDILLRSICDTMVPKLVADDVPLLRGLMQGVFPGADLLPVEEAQLEQEIRFLCRQRHYEPCSGWLAKVLQLYQIQRLNHGVMLVGPVGTGKSVAWRTLLDAMERYDGVKGFSYVLDAKSVPKEQLYGRLDPTTLEWSDGMFTALLRKILNSTPSSNQANVDISQRRRHWIVFDGDVDPGWAENLNSVLDDNKLLTLPSGERLQIPPNVRIMFEVDSLKFATLATVSRCGMVWFSEDVLPEDAIALHFLNTIRYGGVLEEMAPGGGAGGALATGGPARIATRHKIDFGASSFLGSANFDDSGVGVLSAQDFGPEEVVPGSAVGMGPPPSSAITFGRGTKTERTSSERRITQIAYDTLLPYFEAGEFVSQCISAAAKLTHIMTFTKIRVLESTFSLLRQNIAQCIEQDELRKDNPMPSDQIARILCRSLVFAICWGCGGSMPLVIRQEFCSIVAHLVTNLTSITLPSGLDDKNTLLDYELRIPEGAWHHWRERVVPVEVDPNQVHDANVVIETIDTIRHRVLLAAWLEEKKPFILCGPPGSGKTMTLTSTLKGLSDFDIASLNFSSGTTPELLLKTFAHYCEYVKTSNGVVLRPNQPGKWLIVFGDEINLPQPDIYGTQRVILFMRQMQEYSGFWKLTDQANGHWSWVRMERIQFAGACNPPTDAGRHPMSDRFLRHAPLLFVDFPGNESLKQIYGTFSRALLRQMPAVRTYGDALTAAMVEFYDASQQRFTVDHQPHYIYSPRELSRWKLALWKALEGRNNIELAELARLFVYEGQRIFQDRLVEQVERDWTDEALNTVVLKHFPALDSSALRRPILFSTFVSHNGEQYQEVSREELREVIQAKLRVFNEEELSVQLVLFDQVLDHITRIDRVLRQPLGHLLLVGASGAGKTVLSKFVSWLNGLSVFQIKAGRNYDTVAFEADLRTVMKRAGLKDESITFIFDESNALGPAFLERMNALLASGEVPGLFEGDEYTQLMSEARQTFSSDTSMDESDLFVRFTKQVQKNLHIVFTMNPANPDFSNRQATSPALFNRCVIDWFGDWPHEALLQVAHEFTVSLELAQQSFTTLNVLSEEERHDRLSTTIVNMHEAVAMTNERLLRTGKKYNYLTPRDFLDFIRHFTGLVSEKRAESAENTKHLRLGLSKLKETEVQVVELQVSLEEKEVELTQKNRQAEEKMQLMIEQQAVAEERKKEAEALAAKLDEKSGVIHDRRAGVEVELRDVEPLLREAQSAVSNIPKKYLDELRSLANPPAAVKFAVEAVVVMLTNSGATAVTWEEVRKVLKGSDFINRVLQFDANSMSSVTVNRVSKAYLETEQWDKEKILRASKAAGPLAQWAESSLRYQVIVQKVEPLRREITELEQEFVANQQQLQETQAEIVSLEQKLQSYKAEYAQLIADVQTIKQAMESVNNKVQRSSQLLKNLTSEKERWGAAADTSSDQLITVLGDCLLAAGFCTYLGFFESTDRAFIQNDWEILLDEGSVKTREDLSLVEYLSRPSDRYQWTGNSLPTDDLSIENAIILQRFIRYPLIIDPSGQASAFLMNQYADKKIMKTSFTEPSFFKNLESALRFGTPLLVQDVERVDPILNSVLNQETHKAGGRVLITVGDSDIDLSPMFTMFLTTRDPTAQFSPDLCSRVTFVNFTLTPSSLQNQCLNLVLRAERPDVDKKRNDILKLQGEFRIRMRDLEESLLHALSHVSGNILDDETVMTTLETLKQQAAEVQQEASKADEVMLEVNKMTAMYLTLAQAAARIYFTLQSMHHLFYLYHYDLHFFESVFHFTLHDMESLRNVTDKQVRLKLLFEALFRNIYYRVSVGVLQSDRLVFSLELARIWYETQYEAQLSGRELEFLVQGVAASNAQEKRFPDSPTSDNATALSNVLATNDRVKSVLHLRHIKAFETIDQHILNNEKQWRLLLTDATPEKSIPAEILDNTAGDRTEEQAFEMKGPDAHSAFLRTRTAIRTALIVRAIRPDRLLPALNNLVETICGNNFGSVPEMTQEELHHFVTKVVTAAVPVILVSSPGFDPSAKIVAAAQKQRQHLASIAMGSEEGYKGGDTSIASAARQGTWVLLKNVHLCNTAWLHQLEKKLFRMKLHENFRVFLTMEFSEKVPSNLFRVSYVFVFEAPAGLKASMQRTYSQIVKPPRQPLATRSHLHFLLAFLHAVILERKRYVPFGWSKGYEFSDADQQCAFEVVDQWLDNVASNGMWNPPENMLAETIDPRRVPFAAMRVLLIETVYGGRLDNEVDKRALQSFVNHLFRAEALDTDFELAAGYNAPGEQSIPALVGPDIGRSQDSYLEYIDSMRAIDEPVWLGLAPHADRLVSARQAAERLARWLTLHSKSADELRDLTPASLNTVRTASSIGFKSGRLMTRAQSLGGGWLNTDLRPRVSNLQALLPANLKNLMRTDEGMHDPIFRCLDREVGSASKLLARIKSDLNDLQAICSGEMKFTNELREIARQVTGGIVPAVWSRHYTALANLPLSEWLQDLACRVAQLSEVSREFGGAAAPEDPSDKVSLTIAYSDRVKKACFGERFKGECNKTRLWFGGLIYPTAFITATRQAVAQKIRRSLDDLDPVIDIGEAASDDKDILLGGAILENASWDPKSKTLALIDSLVEALPPLRLRWLPREVADVINVNRTEVPIFLTKERTDLIMMCQLPVPSGVHPEVWSQRGVAVVLWSQL